MAVKPGIQVLIEEQLDLLKSKSVGLITNQTGLLPDLSLNVEGLLDANVNLQAIFAPEQGFRGEEQAGYSSGGYTDVETGVKVYTLYEKTPEEILDTFKSAQVDVVLFDLQDVGSRFYTYIWTLADTLEAIATEETNGIQLVVLDRPNPLGGIKVDGPLVESGLESFVGRYAIPLIHGMTTGELAVLFNTKFVPEKLAGKRANLEVAWMKGWERSQFYDETGLPFVFPSVNLPTLDSVLVYPGQGLFEGIKISEGRGTTHPFEIVGAPFIDYKLAKRLNSLQRPGVHYLESHFSPTFRDFVNESCTGVQLYVKDRHQYDQLVCALDIITAVRDLYPDKFAFGKTFDVLAGSLSVREAITGGKSTDEIVGSWQSALEGFKQLRKEFLHY